ncbi:MAG: LamG-like jellyroll fold domain-containing protein [Nannocystaceae bacterium]
MNQALLELLTRQYSDREYRHATLLNHQGALIGFAMDRERRIYYVVLDPARTAALDRDGWSAMPQRLEFPAEITTVGYAVVDNKSIPPGGDPFLATTARLTADAPFQVVSDRGHVLLFRQSIGAQHPDAVMVRDAAGELVLDAEGQPIPLVDETLLVDRFVLSGTLLVRTREIRYRRSRHRTRPASDTDSLGARDMNNVPFHEPTQELAFVRGLTEGRFSALLVPTRVADLRRWQLFCHNRFTDRIDSFNIERSSEGLFNTLGTRVYTCPDHPEHVSDRDGRCPLPSTSDASERCPYALIQRREGSGFAESALRMDGASAATIGAVPEGFPGTIAADDAPRGLSISTWIKPAGPGVIVALGRPEQPALSLEITAEGQLLARLHNAGVGERVLRFPSPPEEAPEQVTPAVSFDMWSFVSLSLADAREGEGSLELRVGELGERFDAILPVTGEGPEARRLSLGRGLDGAGGLVGVLDELQIWDRPRGAGEVRESRSRRLVGGEPGLVAYWRFDEGSGATVHDQTDHALHLQIEGSAAWIRSDAPIGDHVGIRRTSFGFAGRSIRGGLASLLFYQQEAADGAEDAPVKQAARVLLAVSTRSEGPESERITALDLGVAPDGRLSQIPDHLELASVDTAGPSIQESLERAVALEAQIPALKQRIALRVADRTGADNDVVLINFQLDDRQRGLDALNAIGVRFFRGYQYNGESLFVTAGTTGVLPPEWQYLAFSARCEGGAALYAYRDVARTDLWQSTTVGYSVYPIYSTRPPIRAYWVAAPAGVVQQRAALSAQMTQLRANIQQIQDVVVPAIEQDLAALRSELALAEAELAEVRAHVLGDASAAMPLVHIDPKGMYVTGGVLEFARAAGAPTLFDSAVGQLGLHFRGMSGRHEVVHYDTNVARAGLVLGRGGLALRARAPGPDGVHTRLTVGPCEVDAACCDVSLSNEALGVVETWRRAPRDPAAMAAVLSGRGGRRRYVGRLAAELDGAVDALPLDGPLGERTGAGASVELEGGLRLPLRATGRPGDTSLQIAAIELGAPITAGSPIWILDYDYAAHSATTMGAYDTRRGSLLASAIGASPGSVADTTPEGVPLVGPARASRWVADPPGNAVDLADAHLDAGDDAPRLTVTGSRTIEAWFRPRTLPAVARLIEQRSPAGHYGLALDPTAFPSALSFDGNDHVVLDAYDLRRRSFTVEIYARRVAGDSGYRFFLSQGSSSSNGNLLHIGFRETHRMTFAFYGDDLNTAATYNDDAWHHWAFVYEHDPNLNRGQRFIYRDGVEVARDKSSSTFNATGPLWVGGHIYTAFRYRGSLDELRIWHRALSQDEINARRDRRLGGDEAGLVGYYRFEEGLPQDHLLGEVRGTVVGNPQVADSWLVGYRLRAEFDGSARRAVEIREERAWTHAAATFQESHAITFGTEGAPFGAVGCGNSPTLDLDDELTIEVTFSPASGATLALLTKGQANAGVDEHRVAYSLYYSQRGSIGFVCTNSAGVQQIVASPRVDARRPSAWIGRVVKIAVTRARVADFDEGDPKYTVALHFNGQQVASQVLAGSLITNRLPLALGRAHGNYDAGGSLGRLTGNQRASFHGTLSEVRLWSTARAASELHGELGGTARGLVSRWTFAEGEGPTAGDAVGVNHGALDGGRWVVDPDPQAHDFTLYLNGSSVASEVASPLPPLGDEFTLGRGFDGLLDEVRIWRTRRDGEALLDNMFGPLKGERALLAGYFTFDADPMRSHMSDEPLVVRDASLQGARLRASGGRAVHVLSTAPLSNEAAFTRDALAGIETTYQVTIDAAPAVGEYADIQTTPEGAVRGVLKRCYSHIAGGAWQLVTGFKVGDLITEWLGQVQFDPQIKGYIEGAPPMPSENLTAGPRRPATRDYLDTAVVELSEADDVIYSLSTSRERGFGASLEAKATLAGGAEISTIIAPLGLGIEIEGKALLSNNLGTKLETDLNWQDNHQITVGRSFSRRTGVSLSGNWEDPDHKLNQAMTRRFQPANIGYALVESETADVFALRLAHNRALVALRMLPNPDIPRDSNLIPFAINPRYTKQGTLDGAVGYDAAGKVLDPDYPQAAAYGEYSYFKPSEAYRLRRRIDEDEQRLRAYYEDFSTTPPGAGGITRAATIAGAVGGAAVAPLVGVSPSLAPVAAIGVAGAIQASAIDTAINYDNDLPEEFAARDIVNRYVWTADGGFFEEATRTLKSTQESTSGSYSFKGSLQTGLGLSAEGSGGAAFKLEAEVNAAFSGSLNLTRTRTESASSSFEIKASVAPPGDLQAYTEPEYERIYDADGDPVVVPGKVDAYRFMTFYRAPAPEHHDAFFSTVVDPIWLDQSSDANAAALRQAQQSGQSPACWRVFHRVTFISRILPGIPDEVLPPLERAIKAADISSNWALIQRLDPFVRDKVGDVTTFVSAVRSAIERYLPELSPEMETVVTYLASYYGVEIE